MGPDTQTDDAQTFLNLKTRSDLAAWLGVNDRKLRYVLYSLTSAQKYSTFKIKKRNGGDRAIDAPISFLKHAQKKIHDAVRVHAPASRVAKGFVPGRSIYDHASMHRSKRWVVAADLANFFPSINFGRVRGAFLSAPFRFPAEVATCIAQLCCKDGCLPQGAPTSPVISNLICRRLDRDLVRIATANKCTVTRYADDICFSTNVRELPAPIAQPSGHETFLPGSDLQRVVEENGFSLNTSKFRVMAHRDQQMVTGLIVNQGVAAPRRWRRQLRVMLHVLDRHGDEKGIDIVKGWNKPALRNTVSVSLNNVVRGKSQFAWWLDGLTGTGHVRALHRAYPTLRAFLPRTSSPVSLRLMTEGDTDALHLEKALSSLQQNGEFLDLLPKFKNYAGDKGDRDLWETLMRIAKTDVDELTVAIFDCDNPQMMKEKAVSPGDYVRLGRTVYALFLPPPAAGYAAPFCIESLYRRDEATRLTADERRLFFSDEFDPSSGLDATGLFKREFPKKTALVLSDRVERLSDSKSVLLSKMDFAKMISVGAAPFGEVTFSGFRPAFLALRNIAAEVYGDRAD